MWPQISEFRTQKSTDKSNLPQWFCRVWNGTSLASILLRQVTAVKRRLDDLGLTSEPTDLMVS